MTKQIKLTKGYFSLIDEEDFERISEYKWYVNETRGMIYARGHLGNLARFIMNAPKNTVVDHINGNGLDNRKCNLRVTTQSFNVFNARKKAIASSKYKGVRLCKDGSWQSRIQINKKSIHLGCFNTEEEAAIAYNMAALRYFREFARLNYI